MRDLIIGRLEYHLIDLTAWGIGDTSLASQLHNLSEEVWNITDKCDKFIDVGARELNPEYVELINKADARWRELAKELSDEDLMKVFEATVVLANR